MEIKDIIKEHLTRYVNEQKAFDKLSELRKWYESEDDKLKSITDFKIWKIKHDRLFKQYTSLVNELNKEQDPHSIKGDMNANFVYHYTTASSLFDILSNNEMIGGGDEYGGISFSSHPNLYKRGFVFWFPTRHSEGKHHGNIGVKIKFDFNLMKQDGFKFKRGSENMGTHSGEEELRLLKDEITNPIKYIKEVIIFTKKDKDYDKLIVLLEKNKIKYHLI